MSDKQDMGEWCLAYLWNGSLKYVAQTLPIVAKEVQACETTALGEIQCRYSGPDPRPWIHISFSSSSTQ